MRGRGLDLLLTAAIVGEAIGIAFVLASWPRATVELAASRPDDARATPSGDDAPRVEVVPQRPASASRPDVGSATTEADAGTPDDPLGLVLTGMVVDSDGSPVHSYGWVQACSRVNADGRSCALGRGTGYRLTGLEPGRWRVHARADGWVTTTREVDLDANQRVTRLDLVLTRQIRIVVKLVTPAGEPLMPLLFQAQTQGEFSYKTVPGAVATAEAPAARHTEIDWRTWQARSLGTWIDAASHGRSVSDTIGELRLDRPPPLFVSLVLSNVVLGTQRLAAGQTEVTFRMSLADVLAQSAGLTAQVVDEGGRALAGVEVDLYNPIFGTVGGAFTKDDGAARLTGKPSGPFKMIVAKAGHGCFEQFVVLEPGRVFDAGIVRLGAVLSIEGQVVDRAGGPVRQTVEYLGLDRLLSSHDVRRGQEVTCAADGRFRIDDRARGRYLLRVVDRDRDRVGWAIVDLVDRSRNDVRIELRPSRLLRLVPRLPADHTWGFSYGILAPDDTPLFAGGIDRDFETIVWMASGAFTVEVLRDGRRVRAIPVVIGDAGATIEVP